MPRSRRERLHPPPPGPDWLERLRTAIFAVHPQLDHAAALEGEPVLCVRTLLPLGDVVRYQEAFLDPRTYEVKRSWSLDLQTAAFVGYVPETLFAVHTSLVLRAIAARQAGLTAPRPAPPLSHDHFVQLVTGRGAR